MNIPGMKTEKEKILKCGHNLYLVRMMEIDLAVPALRPLTYEQLAQNWATVEVGYQRYYPRYRTYEIFLNLGHKQNYFVMAPFGELKRVCSNGVGAPCRPIEQSNTIRYAQDVLKECR